MISRSLVTCMGVAWGLQDQTQCQKFFCISFYALCPLLISPPMVSINHTLQAAYLEFLSALIIAC